MSTLWKQCTSENEASKWGSSYLDVISPTGSKTKLSALSFDKESCNLNKRLFRGSRLIAIKTISLVPYLWLQKKKEVIAIKTMSLVPYLWLQKKKEVIAY